MLLTISLEFNVKISLFTPSFEFPNSDLSAKIEQLKTPAKK
jgi:hypothetical protein